MSQRRRAFRLSDGTIVYDVFGADSGDENEDDEDDDELDDDDADDAEDDDDNEDDDDSSKDKKRKTRAELEADLAEAVAAADRATRRMKRADRAKSKTVNELNALKTGTAKDLADAQAKITELEGQLAAKSGTDTTSLIREEFRDSDLYDWHDRKVAFSLLDLNEVDVDDDGTVDTDSLKDAIEKLAKDKPYLIKTKAKAKDEDEDDEDDDDKEKPGRRSGAPVNGRKRSSQQKSEAQVKDKFPILQGRF